MSVFRVNKNKNYIPQLRSLSIPVKIINNNQMIITNNLMPNQYNNKLINN